MNRRARSANRFRLWSSTFAGLGVLTFGIVQACTAGGGSTLTQDDGGPGSGAGSSVGGNLTSVGQGGSSSSGFGGGCANETIEGDGLPLDMYIMLDQSGSMGSDNKWSDVTSAIQNFMALPESAGLGVGIQYFPAGPQCPEFCGTTPDCGTGCGTCMTVPFFGGICTGPGDACNVSEYATPEVPIGVLPGIAMDITTSLAAHGPTGGTPTAPALTGAIDYARSHALANPNHVTIVVLATDGLPQACDPQDIPSIAQIAAAGVSGTPSILTFVIGVGNELSNLNAIAQGGGTNQAFIVDAGNNAEQQFLAALEAIKGTALGCAYGIPEPESGTPDFDHVNVQYTPEPGAEPQPIPYVGSEAGCPPNGDGWYYNDASAPTQIILCPYTCDRVEGDEDGKIDIVLGCETLPL